MYPDELSYTREHEWIRVDGEECTIGITAYAQDELGDVVYVELPGVGAARSETCGPGMHTSKSWPGAPWPVPNACAFTGTRIGQP